MGGQFKKCGLSQTIDEITYSKYFWKEMVTSENLSGCEFQIS